MYEFLWHGRGGQGAFTAARLLGAAWSLKDSSKSALAFPSFGPERRGAPVRAFTRLDTKTVGNRSEIFRADFVVFLDDTLFSEKAFDELKDGGKIILSTKHPVDDDRVISIDGVALAVEYLSLPITNTVLTGVIPALFSQISTDDLEHAIRCTMAPKLQERNIKAVKAAYEIARGQLK
ncbi:MAG: 2-oxoacid:acceptor oxidoreductase family protein [Succinivibrio sp.]